MIAVDNNPLSMSEKRGFKHFMKVAVPLFAPPSRKTITKLMDCKFETLSEKIKIDLEKIKQVCLTTDCWTDFNTKTFMGLTVHYPKNAVIISINLGAFPLQERHTSDYLGQQLIRLCTQRKILKSSVTTVITDDAPNIVGAACNTFGSSHHIGCFAHSIQLIPQNAIE